MSLNIDIRYCKPSFTSKAVSNFLFKFYLKFMLTDTHMCIHTVGHTLALTY